MEEHDSRETGSVLLEVPIVELELGVRPEKALAQAGIVTVGQALDRLQQGDESLLAIEGFGQKSLIDLKKRLRQRGLSIPEEQPAPGA
ncbi:MAG: DNA-directed RNA polymerase subunit alpha C-terminal domain-containing protein [Anaerolineales bacterium]